MGLRARCVWRWLSTSGNSWRYLCPLGFAYGMRPEGSRVQEELSMNRIKGFLAFFAICLVTEAVGFPMGLVGKWVGHVHMYLPQDLTANECRDAERESAPILNAVFDLNLRADWSFAETVRTPRASADTRISPAFVGTWFLTQAGPVLDSGSVRRRCKWLRSGTVFRETIKKGRIVAYFDFSRA
jgi:hypothetical protein